MDLPGVAERCFQSCEVYHLHRAVFPFQTRRRIHPPPPPVMIPREATPQLDLLEERCEERDVAASITCPLRFINVQSSEHVRLKTNVLHTHKYTHINILHF